jgi:eukaryotic-like serine/threonine-protein kinase
VARGDVIAGRYRLDAEIGSGGMGEVWRATDVESAATVALKRVRLAHLAPEDRERARERLRAEAGIASRLEHPHIITVRRLVEHDGEPWLVMEYVPAPNLAELTADGPLPPRRVAGIGAQVAEALAYAHGAGVLHRDVTPRNLLVGEDDHVTLTDFGISKIEGEDTIGTGGRPFAGVAAYVAPEVANGVKGGPKADVFSLGATLYASVEGRSPWGDGDLVQTLAAAMKGDVDPPRRAGALGPVLVRMLQRRPRDRPSAAAAAQMLGKVASGETVDRRRWPWIAAVAAVAVATALGLVLWPRPAPDTMVAVAAPPGLGDPATADPCSLIRTEPFDRFGETTLETDYGNFDRCDVIMESGQDRFAARVLFDLSSERLPDGPREERNGIVIVRGAQIDEECGRTLRLPDGYDVDVSADSERGALPDLCAVADVATDTALAVLTRGQVPRRSVPFDPTSLAVVDACGLLDAATVATVPGLETAEPDRDFAGWRCDWQSPTSRSAIQIYYDRHQGLDDDMGTPTRIAGHDAAVERDEDGSGCDVTVLHRSYADPRGDQSDELLNVEVDQPEPVADPCVQAIAVATVAVGRLPATP